MNEAQKLTRQQQNMFEELKKVSIVDKLEVIISKTIDGIIVTDASITPKDMETIFSGIKTVSAMAEQFEILKRKEAEAKAKQEAKQEAEARTKQKTEFDVGQDVEETDSPIDIGNEEPTVGK
jgi:hypothetical protein